MSDPFRDAQFPRTALVGAAALIMFTFTAAWLSVETDVGATRLETAEVVQMRDLVFRDGNDGAVLVLDARDGSTVHVIPSGAGGFERGVLRSLARERRAHAQGQETPFRLSRRINGTLSIEDPSTGRRVDLDAFGATNAQTFSRLVGRMERAEPTSKGGGA